MYIFICIRQWQEGGGGYGSVRYKLSLLRETASQTTRMKFEIFHGYIKLAVHKSQTFICKREK